MTSRRTKRNRRLVFESLERRLALAAIAELAISTASTINAGPLSNVIVVRRAANNVDLEISIDGVLTNTYPLSATVPLTINGQGGNDVLLLDYLEGNPNYVKDNPIPEGGLNFNGGNDAEDVIMVQSASFLAATQSFTTAKNGKFQFSQLICSPPPILCRPFRSEGRVLNYTGVAASTFIATQISTLIFNLPTGPNRGVTLGDDDVGATRTSQLRGETIGTTYFPNPFSLQVNLGNSGDSFAFARLDPEFLPGSVVINGGNGNDSISGSGLDEILNGGGGNDTLAGGAGSDRLTGGPGNDNVIGGEGNDIYLFDADVSSGTDTLTELADGGVDTLNFDATQNLGVALNLSNASLQALNANLSIDLNLGTTFENIFGSTRNDLLSGNGATNDIFGNNGNDRIYATSGGDRLDGGLDNDTYLLDTDALLGNVNIRESVAGADTLDFSSTTTRPIQLDLSRAGPQVVNAGLTLNLEILNAVENVVGGRLSDQLRGNSLANRLTGNAGNDLLSGGGGNDTYLFDADVDSGVDRLEELVNGGIDTLDFSSTTQAVTVDLSNPGEQQINNRLLIDLNFGSTFENVIGGQGADQLTGNALSNNLTGRGGNDRLTGLAGNDRLVGESGDDIYLFDTDSSLGTDELVEQVNGGLDTLDFGLTSSRSVSLNLGTESAQMVNAGLVIDLNAASTFEGVLGGALADTLTGNAINNVLEGGPGNDRLVGLRGDDKYVFDADHSLGTDTLIEAVNEGFDLLEFSSTDTRSVTVSLFELNAQQVNEGLSIDLSSNETFEGVIGGAGNDFLVGNGVVNQLRGSEGNDLLFATPGAERFIEGGELLAGGPGNDTYVFDCDAELGSISIDESEGGIDTLDFSSTTTISAFINLGFANNQDVCRLTLTLGSEATVENVVGTNLDDSLLGNALNNRLFGRGGNDQLQGGAGNDTYVFDADNDLGLDIFFEPEDGGVDTLDFSLTTNRFVIVDLSKSSLQQVADTHQMLFDSEGTFENIIGSQLADHLIGNAKANVLNGAGGNDILSGGGGSDTLIGRLGDDTYQFDTDFLLGTDTVVEAIGEGFDTLDFGATTARSISVNLGNALPQVINAGLTLDLSSGETIEKVVGGKLGDTIVGNSLNNILLGGDGDDTLRGGLGRDLIISNAGADSVFGEGGEDLLIAGSTFHDADGDSLLVFLSEWSDTTKSYLTRITNLRTGIRGVHLGGTGLDATVTSDLAKSAKLNGGADRDWFFADVNDLLADRISAEVVDVLL